VRGNVIRFLPPLTIEPALLAEALDAVAASVRELGREAG
jgi:4-aminobutyrate aminotransferase-like enzyme